MKLTYKILYLLPSSAGHSLKVTILRSFLQLQVKVKVEEYCLLGCYAVWLL
jgi:hypothetical protein